MIAGKNFGLACTFCKIFDSPVIQALLLDQKT